MRVCSFLPAATEMIYRMGLEELLCGVTFECNSDKPKIVRSILENKNYNSSELNCIISQIKAQGKSLYYIDEDLLQSLLPDVIFTQDACDIGQIDTGYLQRCILNLRKQPNVVSLRPRNLADVFDNIVVIGRTMGKEGSAYRLLAELKQKTESITDVIRSAKAPVRRVMFAEWLDPLHNCGHWIPDMIAQAGGVDLLSSSSGYAGMISWEKLHEYDPEVLVIAPSGFKPQRTLQEMNKLIEQEGWDDLTAVKNNTVFIADGSLFTRPGPRLVEGIELLAALFYPKLFSIPKALSKKVICFNKAFVSR